jgi:thioredoxin
MGIDIHISKNVYICIIKIHIMLEHLTKESFKEKVFNFELNKDWKYEGKTPCMIDFYADWCGPCKMVAPVLEELQKEYGENLVIYKVNTEDERELSAMFGIQSIPSLLFVPVEGQPQMAMGALPKSTFEKAIADVLKVNKPTVN